MQWQFAAPCAVSLTLPDEETGSELQTSIEAALRQLSCLPAGSEVCVLGTHNLDTLAASSAAIAATKSAMPHVTVWPVDMRGCDRVVGALCAPAYQGASVGLYDFKLSGAHAQVWYTLRHVCNTSTLWDVAHTYSSVDIMHSHTCMLTYGTRRKPVSSNLMRTHVAFLCVCVCVCLCVCGMCQAPWPWKRLWINTTITFTQLLRLPNPCQGEYEVIVDFIKCDISQASVADTHIHT